MWLILNNPIYCRDALMLNHLQFTGHMHRLNSGSGFQTQIWQSILSSISRCRNIWAAAAATCSKCMPIKKDNICFIYMRRGCINLTSPRLGLSNAFLLGGRAVHRGTLVRFSILWAIDWGGVWRSHVQLQKHDVLSLKTLWKHYLQLVTHYMDQSIEKKCFQPLNNRCIKSRN